MFPYMYSKEVFLRHCGAGTRGSRGCEYADYDNDLYDKAERCSDCPICPELIDILIKRITASDPRCDRSKKGREIRSWCQSVCVHIADVISSRRRSYEIPSGVKVGLEFFVENETNERADVMLAGCDRNGNKKVVIIELKQYSRQGLKDYDEKKPVEKTIEEVRDSLLEKYCEPLCVNNSAVWIKGIPEKEIEIVPVIFFHNLDIDDKTKNELEIVGWEIGDNEFDANVNIFGKGQEDELLALLIDNLGGTSNNPRENKVFTELKKGQPCASMPLTDNIERIVNGNDKDKDEGSEKNREIVLRADQKKTLEKIEAIIEKVINNKSNTRIIVVNGGPGSGKTLLALKLYSRFKDNSIYINPSRAPIKTYKKVCSDLKPAYPSEVQPENVEKIAIIDEAQRCKTNEFLEKICKEENGFRIIVLFGDSNQRIENDRLNLAELTDIEGYDERYGKPKLFQLISQFRCNQDDGYLSFIDTLLYGKPEDLDYWEGFESDFDFHVIEDVHELQKMIVDLDKTDDERSKSEVIANTSYSCTDKRNKPITHYLGETIIIKKNDWEYSANDKKIHLKTERTELTADYKDLYDVNGLEYPEVIVIIGKEMKYDSETGLKDIPDNIKNRYRILLTRGLQKCSVFCEDENLKEKFKMIE